MKRTTSFRLLLVAIVAMMMCPCNLKAEWKMAKVSIQTPFAAAVNPDNALPEYPRPQMVRSEWINLCGVVRIAMAFWYSEIFKNVTRVTSANRGRVIC